MSSTRKYTNIYATRYNRWYPEERASLFPNLTYLRSAHSSRLSVIPKVGSTIGAQILNKLSQFSPAPFVDSSINIAFYVHRIPYNFIKAFDFIPYFWNEVDGEKKSEDYKPYSLGSRKNSRTMLAVLNSNLFFWWWYTLFEGYHCGRHEIHSFPISLDRMSSSVNQSLSVFANDLMVDYRRNSERREAFYKSTGRVVYEQFSPKLSKSCIDNIDRCLAIHYKFTDEELDFIINYDIKYRMGDALANEEDENTEAAS